MEAKKVVIIGGGPGGYVAAIRAAQLGADVTVVERRALGGTCLNVGCIPTKCLLRSAGLLEDLKRRGGELGIRAERVSVDFRQVMAHKNKVSSQLSAGVAGLLKLNRVRVIEGSAAFTGPKTLELTRPDGGREPLCAGAVIVAAGSVNAAPAIPGLSELPCRVDSTGALSLETLPKSMAVIGGGVIGLELACAYAAFGTRVTVVEAMDQMLPMLDEDLVKIGVNHMRRMGVEFRLGCPVRSAEPSPAGARILYQNRNGELEAFEAETVLVAAGRRANTDGLGLEAGGLAHDRGAILVNDQMETSVPGVYAVGDCVRGYAQLAHTASAMGEVAAENIMGLRSRYQEATNPTCVYMEPEAASVGLTEQEARKRGVSCKTGKFPLSANGKALILNGGEGLVKILADGDTGAVLGLHIIGPRATDLIGEGALAIRVNATVEDLISTIHSHPTITEAVREAALNVEKRAVHIRN